jgi:hypothetical protein
MNKNMLIGISISVINLLFYATFLDLIFYSGIFEMLFGLDLLKVFGEINTSIGVIAITIAIFLEVISYRVIRNSNAFSSDMDK